MEVHRLMVVAMEVVTAVAVVVMATRRVPLGRLPGGKCLWALAVSKSLLSPIYLRLTRPCSRSTRGPFSGPVCHDLT